MTSKNCNGPLFLVGMPRSGTKLLRTLLNEHPGIFISQVETHFIPYWHANWGSYGDLKTQLAFSRFYEDTIKLPYFTYMQELQGIISCEEWYSRCERYDLSGVFEALIRYDAGAVEDALCIWGDKTPSYLTHMGLLKELFPDARFVHIVRDVRDYCLSSKQAWGKNMLRAAQSWSDGVSAAILEGNRLGEDHLLIRYEDLIRAPEVELRSICRFLDISFVPSMLTMTASAENLGDAKGSRSILSNNTEKYLSRMDAGVLTKIESITTTELKSLGYSVTYSGSQVRLSPTRLRLLQLIDGLNLIRFEVGNRGLIEAIKFRWKLFVTSGYRG